MIRCPECGFENEDAAKACSSCGCPLEETVAEGQNKPRSSVAARVVGVIMLVAAIVCLVVGTGTILDVADSEKNDSMLVFLREHYQTCKAGYEESVDMAYDYAPGFFRSSYLEIAESYQEMMEDDQEEIDELEQAYVVKRVIGIVTASCSIPLIVVGCVLLIRRKRG